MHRSTTLNLALSHCPGAITLAEAGTPYLRDQYQAGIAAHACLQGMLDNPGRPADVVCESVVRRLVTEGRSFYGIPEPPMRPEDAMAGRDLALSWLSRDLEGLPDGWRAEVPLSCSDDWKPVKDWKDAWLHAAIDVIGPDAYEDEDTYAEGVIVRDWKSAWGTDVADLDSLQQKIQTVLVSIHHPDAAFIRREVTNLRTGHSHSERLWLDEDGWARIEDMKRDILHAVAHAETRDADGNRPFRPGAGCAGCPFVLRCEAATEAIPLFWSEDPEAPGAADPRVLAQHYAVMRAMTDAMATLLRVAAKESPIQVEGGTVGYEPQERRYTSPVAAEALARAWFQPGEWDAWARENASVLGLLQALSPGASSVESVGKRLWAGRGAGKVEDFKERREALASECLDTKVSAVFGVTRVK